MHTMTYLSNLAFICLMDQCRRTLASIAKMLQRATRPTKQSARKSAIIVIGMHRSGTSVITGALKCLGVHLGANLIPGQPGINPKGYFEHRSIVAANVDALLALDSNWDDIFDIDAEKWMRPELRSLERSIRRAIRREYRHHDLWALKDPRICRMLPWWLDILGSEAVSPYFLFVVRSPHAVYRSLNARNGFSLEKSMLLWVLHYLDAERATRNHARVIVSLQQLLDWPAPTLARVEERLGIDYPTSIDVAAPCLNQLIDKELNHYPDASEATVFSDLCRLAYEVYTEMCSASGPRPDEMDSLRARIDTIRNGLPPLALEQLRSTAGARGVAELTARKVMRSWSWTLTRPMRQVERWLGRRV